MHFMKRAFLLAGIAMLGACLNVAEPPDEPTDPATEEFASTTGVDIATMTKTASGVYYKDLTIGQGGTVSGDQVVSITYVGYLKSGYIFDRGTQPTAIKLGQGIVGFMEGMQGMKVGGTRKIVIPSQRAYGQYGFPAYGIPPNSTLVYDVQLLDLP
jgi:FKBP-type peptidyl-prolyl cis-trans isomerase